MTQQRAPDAEMTLASGAPATPARHPGLAPPPLPTHDIVRPGSPGSGLRPARRKVLLGLSWPWLAAIAGGIVLAGVVGMVVVRNLGAGAGESGPRLFPVKRGPLRVAVLSDGTIRSDRTVDIRSQIQGKASILDIVAESTRVEKGDFLVKLDASDVEKQRDTQNIKVQQLAAAASQSDADLEIQQNLNKSDIDKAELALETAQIEANKYEKGDYPAAVQTAQNAIILAKQQLSLAANRYDWSTKLKDKGFISASELEADQLARDKSKLDLELANTNLGVLQNYTYKRESMTRKWATTAAEAEVIRTVARTCALEARFRTNRQTNHESYDLEKKQLDKLEAQVRAGTILAPQSGLVVYYSTGKPRWQVRFVVDVGVQVQENDPIISLPDLNVMVADVTVPEAKRTEIQEGQPAVVRVAVQPDRPLAGRVKSRGIMPVQQDPWRRGDVQQFQVVVEIPNPPDWLLPGLACSVDVTIQNLPDVVQVPIQAVFDRDGQHVCYVVDDRRIRAVPVLIGQDDDRMVEIRAGLKEGWQVMEVEPENPSKIAVEPATFEKPRVLARPEPPIGPPAGSGSPPVDSHEGGHATTQADRGGGVQPVDSNGRSGRAASTTAPDLPDDIEVARTLARLRQSDPKTADLLLKLSPADRRKAVVELRKQAGEAKPPETPGGRGPQ